MVLRFYNPIFAAKISGNGPKLRVIFSFLWRCPEFFHSFFMSLILFTPTSDQVLHSVLARRLLPPQYHSVIPKQRKRSRRHDDQYYWICSFRCPIHHKSSHVDVPDECQECNETQNVHEDIATKLQKAQTAKGGPDVYYHIIKRGPALVGGAFLKKNIAPGTVYRKIYYDGFPAEFAAVGVMGQHTAFDLDEESSESKQPTPPKKPKMSDIIKAKQRRKQSTASDIDVKSPVEPAEFHESDIVQ